MARYLIAVVVGCIYVAGSIWAVQRQGKAYRDELRRAKLATTVIERASPALPEEKARDVAFAGPVRIASPRTESTAVKPAPERPAPTSEASADDAAPPAPPRNDLAKAKVLNRPSVDLKAGQPADVTPPTAESLLNGPLWNKPHLTRNWDLSALKPDDEMRLGAQLHDQIVQFNPLAKDGPWLARVEDAAEPFLKNLRRGDITYKFFILDSDAVNAFSHPGGYVYVSRGLFDLIGEDEDYLLEFVIGHEIAHVDLQHAIRCLQDPDIKNMTEGTIQKLYWLIIPLGYLESDKVVHEYEADEWVANRMRRLERTPRETLMFLKKLDGYAKTNGFYNGHAEPLRDASPLENHYRALTAARKRLKHLKEIMEAASKSPK